MTLTSVPPYDRERASVVGEHAVVVGASVAGTLAARVLSDTFEAVTVVERDPLPNEPRPRTGVPHGEHPHALLEAGRATIEDLFPGYVDELVSRGGMVVDASSDFRFFSEGDFLADGPNRKPMYAASRALIEHVLRTHVADLDGVRIRDETQCIDYRFDDQAMNVEGVVIRENGDDPEELASDLVVDATGRTSRTPTWLDSNGYRSPDLDEVHVDLAYSTLLIERPSDDNTAILGPASPPHSRGGSLAPIEDERWQVTVHGVHGETPPTDVECFVEFASTLPFPDLERFLAEHPPVSEEVEYYPFPSNRRHRYEDLDLFPNGLVVIGDAIASFNPIYGQGMSVAALEALILHYALSTNGLADLPARFFDRAEEVVDIAWTMAVGADFQFPETTGPKPRGTDLVNRYLSRLTRRAQTDGVLRDRLFRVFMMEEPPTSLFRPNVIARVLSPFDRTSGSILPWTTAGR